MAENQKNLDGILTDISTNEITTLKQLYEIQTKNAPSNVYLPLVENTYDIDLKTREIHGPNFISVQRDHKSEIIYFKIDRYFDYMDLANTICIIEYIIPGDKEKIPHIYVVPFYDTTKYMNENKMIFPWSVGGSATLQSGTIEYAIRFFKIDGEGKNAKLVYNLNTLPTKSKILNSIESDEEIMKAEYDIPVEAYEELLYQLKNNRTYWTIL